MGGIAGGWLECYRPNPSVKLRLFCLPHAGGGAAACRGWASRLPETVEVCPVQPPGRGGRLRELPLTSVDALARAAASALAPMTDLPFAVFGHSLGAIVAFELCRRLQGEHGRSPAYLFASGRRGPRVPNRTPPLHVLPEAELVDVLRVRYNAVPAAVLEEPELLALLLPVLRADLQANETYRYRPGPPLDCPIAVYGGRDDREVTEEDLGAWREHTGGGFSMRVFPGDHFFLQSEEGPLLEEITERLRSTGMPL